MISDFDPKEIIFEDFDEASLALDTLEGLAERYDKVTVNDFCDIVGISSYEEYRNDYWLKNFFDNAEVKYDRDGNYYIDLPRPISIKEDKNMAIRYNYNTTCNPNKNCDILRVSSLEFDDPIQVEFEKKKKDLVDEAEKKILDIRQELAAALDKLLSEQHERRMEETERSQAKMWKRKYDALIEAGFSEDQAWQMTMESFKID